MTAPARLLALRLQGFKSFAEKTLVEFGPGISAVVGPNGSGKSNLADALRWALGEQGRALRTRKSEDVIFAGSERRAAIGMADVSLLLDNADGLLGVGYATVELGRRLYRSGENDYLLNRQRVRLRDLVDLLDGAHLADNAFLFIGQGMVDQALSLRPEERRPLFEEVAGVRRHERRRRRAEEQLVEAEGNLLRVEDILAELRPQARRLSVQAEQQATRRSAGDELAAALVVSAHARWYEAADRVAVGAAARERARADADAAMAALAAAEDRVASIAAELGSRVAVEADRRAVHEAARARLTALQLREARVVAEADASARDRARVEAERDAAEADMVAQRRLAARPVPDRDHDAEAELAIAERALAEALAEVAAVRTSRAAEGEAALAMRRAAAARQAELDAARRRRADLARRLEAERAREADLVARRTELERAATEAAAALAAATDDARVAMALVADRRGAAETAEAIAREAADRHGSASEALAVERGRLSALAGRLAEEEARGIARAARKVGGRRIDEDLVVEPGLRAAVAAALGESARGYLVGGAAVAAIAGERGSLVVEERLAAGAADPAGTLLARVTELGGGRLADAVRRDPAGAARRLLERAVWLPDLGAAVSVQGELPAGWIAVTRDGRAVVGPLVVSLGAPDAVLERRAEHDRIAASIAAAEAALAELAATRDAAAAALVAAQGDLAAARAAEAAALAAQRVAEEVERVAGRELEAALREAAWQAAQVGRLAGEVDRAAAALDALEAADDAPTEPGPGSSGDDGPAMAALEARVGELRGRRDRLAAHVAGVDTARRDAEAARARAEAAAAAAEARLARATTELAGLEANDRSRRSELEALTAELAVATDAEAAAAAALDELRAADAADRGRLADAERDASAARERLRGADDRLRGADVGDLEARLALDAIREGVLVELAGLGEPGRRQLALVTGAPDDEPVAADGAALDGAAPDDDAAALEAWLELAAVRWAAEPPATEPPTPGRLASLRRRYHELGAANPYAVEEYATLKARLDGLEAQHADLRAAIARTRTLIDELDALIAGQFRTTFEALEAAFDRRFGQLFGGGFARLALTDPADLASTGVEIVARPPGKKAQNLAMLSGGERALTAVALLFAMLEVRPVPFCVLDEVDAALDEANVGRFTEALRELAEATQFIVITHNRGTIEAADALYGVTVGDDSVSRVISLRLEEAQALADRAGRADAGARG